MRKTNIALITIIASALTFFLSCGEEEPIIVPDVYVNFDINLDLPQFSPLNAQGNAVKKGGEGYDDNGVVIYRRFDSTDGQPYFAFDATCPQHIGISTSVNLDGAGADQTATCPHCNTQYFLENYGYPNKGYPLKRYRVSQMGRILRISN